MKNEAKLLGCVASACMFSHVTYDENFYKIQVDIERESGTFDRLPVIVSEKLIDVSQDYTGQYIYIEGEFRSHNIEDEEGKKHLFLAVFAQDAFFTDSTEPVNSIVLEGAICKHPTFRKTPLGRQISDVMLAVNRQYGKSDYIPCIAWGRNATLSARLNQGQYIRIYGRIQSREYTKHIDDFEETRTAYEVSVMKLEEM